MDDRRLLDPRAPAPEGHRSLQSPTGKVRSEKKGGVDLFRERLQDTKVPPNFDPTCVIVAATCRVAAQRSPHFIT